MDSRLGRHLFAVDYNGIVSRVVMTNDLIGPLASVAADVSAQLGKLHGGVVALGALVRLLVSVLVAHVTHQLACQQSMLVTFTYGRYYKFC